ncbi:MAG: basic amino acid ABC transporter substrate-binding protein, partial [Myxococcota bacterium]
MRRPARAMCWVGALVGLVLLPAACDSEEEPPPAPAPAPRPAPAAPRPMATGAAFDLVAAADGAVLIWG